MHNKTRIGAMGSGNIKEERTKPIEYEYRDDKKT
jgi:hypothetical protein